MKEPKLWACAVLLFVYGAASADEIKLTPIVALRQEYNSNLFFDDRDKKDDFISRGRAGLDYLHRTERLDSRISGFVTPVYYWDKDELNAVDQDYAGRASFRVSPRFSLGGNAALRVDHQPDRDLAATGLTYGDNRRLRQNYGANAAFAATELWTVSGSYGHGREDWRARGDDAIENWRSHTVTLELSRELGRAPGMTQGLLEGGFTRYDYETSDTWSYFATAGLRHRVHELYALTAILGARYTDTDYTVRRLALVPPGILTVLEDKKNRSGLGGLGRLALDYTGERLRTTATASHDIDASSGRSGIVQRTGGSLSAGYLLLEKLRLGLYVGAFRNKSENEQYAGDRIHSYTYGLTPSLRWEFARDFTFEAGYGFAYVDERIQNQDDAHRHTAYVQLAWGIPLLE